jgi:Restriction endonuclease NotI
MANYSAASCSIPSEYGQVKRPHISEWFGHRIYPQVSAAPSAVADQTAHRCPFLSETLGRPTQCVKQENSNGVCCISALSNGQRQDWLVCPYRALDQRLLRKMVRRLYNIPESDLLTVIPVVRLQERQTRQAIVETFAGRPERVFVYLQDKLGGEVSLGRTPASPEVSFDITVVELLQSADSDGTVRLGRYGVVELQTTDTHGSYKHAVDALRNALDLHPADFPGQLAAHPEWAGRKIEGPNISNVFKRTFYQVAFKFQVTKRDTSVGCLLAIPRPVWDSWQPFLGAPTLREHGDGTWRLLEDDNISQPADWIYVFDVAEDPGEDGSPCPIDVQLIIGTDAATLSKAALDVAPAHAVRHGGLQDAVLATLNRRISTYLPGLDLGAAAETPL